MATRKTEAEWDRIELEYLAGETSVREIADRYSLTEGAIRKRAKAQGWLRAVRKPRSAYRSEPATPRAPRTPAEPEEAAKIAERGRQLVARMLDELEATTNFQGELEELIEAACEGDRDGKRRDGMLSAVGLGARAKTLKELVTSLKLVNEANAPASVKQARQEKAAAVAGRFTAMAPPGAAKTLN